MAQSMTSWRTFAINYTVGNTEYPAIGSNPDRVALIFTAPVGALSQFGIGNLVSYEGVIYSLNSAESIILLYRDLGELVRSAWVSTCQAGLAVGSVTEVYLTNRTVGQ